MAIEVKLPELGENIQGGDVVKVLVQEGDSIDAQQDICELETDKAVVPVPSSHGGKVTKIHIKDGQRVKVGETLLTIEPADGEASKEQEEREEKTAEKPAAQKAEPRAAQAKASAAPSGPVQASPAVRSPVASPEGPIPAGPTARRLAREAGIDLSGVVGTGERGRITPDDVRAAAAAPPEEAPAARQQGAPAWSFEPVTPPGEASQDKWGPVTRERMSQIRMSIAAAMVRSASTIPHVTNFDDADVTELEAMRKSVPEGYLGASVKLTMMPFILKAVATALRRHPMLNASLDEENEQVVYKQYVHLGVAVDTPRGLVVPVIRNVDRMTIPEIARAVASLAERARSAAFALEDLRGGTFTISNMGAVGGTYSTPIINHPEVAILLVGRSRWQPVVRGEEIARRFMMPLSLSYDHRLVDGATAARFLNEVIAFLQSPARLLLMP